MLNQARITMNGHYFYLELSHGVYRQHNGQKKDRQHNGQKKDRQHNGQKDRQHNGQKDRQHNGQK
jgi:hypothetical protein